MSRLEGLGGGAVMIESSWVSTGRVRRRGVESAPRLLRPVIQGWMGYYGMFYRSETVRPSPPHKHLPDAVGATQVQTATCMQTFQTLVGQAPQASAQPVRPLEMDASLRLD